VAAVTLPFLGKAFHIDDPFFHRVTQNIVEDPLDPYAGEIDWWHRPDSVFHSDSNPPLFNYYLAPIAARTETPEFALHSAMVPFYLLLAVSVLALGRRFTASPLWVLLFTMTSAGFIVSGNVMRDVPAAALGTAAVAAMVSGTDSNRHRLLFLGSLLVGMAILTKYSALILLPVIYLYPILKRKPRLVGWAGVPAAMFAVWCLHNHLVYGELHIASQWSRGFNRPGHGWLDNAYGLPVVAGSLLYLLPALLVRSLARRDRWVIAGSGAVALVGWWLVERYTSGGAGPQFLFWALSGSALLFVCSVEGIRAAWPLLRDRGDPEASDSLFLVLWLLGPLVVSTLSVPFQAVRHFLPAFAPLVLLAFRALRRAGGGNAIFERSLLATLLAAQAAVAFLVARADADFAETYRDFAPRVRELVASHRTGRANAGEASVWFVGHWGWSYYAEKAGLRQLHAQGPYPEDGDYLVVPAYADKGKVLERLPRLAESLRKIDQVIYPGRIPIRTMHPSGAGFYALFTKRGPDRASRVPYRFECSTPIEYFEIYEVRSDRSTLRE
jgi:hypothetical protein